MSDVVIRAEGLGKKYVIGHETQRDSYIALRDVIARGARQLLRKAGDMVHGRPIIEGDELEEVWALRDVSFEIGRGEVVGIIGRNGAGKTTLLKVLSRITDPSEGRVTIKGRVASLLEVGTGFHPELTGRENIFLNGAILGMSKLEVKRKFDEIVAFSEVEKFLDTPVKRYSSGMYVRLAFSVAAHMEPEILIVDEILAVGDAAFQNKCIGKMDEVSVHEGRTVLLVSHNIGVINRLCKRAILLKAGQICAVGITDDVTASYLSTGSQTEGIRTWKPGDARWANHSFRPHVLRVLNTEGRVAGRVDITRPFQVELEYEIARPMSRFRVALRFLTGDGTIAFTASDSADSSFETKPISPGTYVSRCVVPGNLLNEGQYLLTVGVDIPFQQVLFVEDAAVGFYVEQTGGVNSRFPEKWPGTVCPILEWKTEEVSQQIAAAGNSGAP